MASILELAQTIQLDDYMTLVVLTAVGYDYILTLPNEIEYIWKQPWTWVSVLFALVRYFGLGCVITFTLDELTGAKSELPFYLALLSCNAFLMFGAWSLWTFVAAADLVMILRIWTLYSRSMLILGALLTLYMVDIILYLVCCIVFTIRNELVVATAQVLNFSVCLVRPVSPLTEAINGIQITLGVLMCLLIIIRFIKHSLQMYKSTKGVELNRYTKLFVKEGIFYFLATLTYTFLNILVSTGSLPSTRWSLLLILVQFIPTFTLVPRFVLSLRELYARDLGGRQE